MSTLRLCFLWWTRSLMCVSLVRRGATRTHAPPESRFFSIPGLLSTPRTRQVKKKVAA